MIPTYSEKLKYVDCRRYSYGQMGLVTPRFVRKKTEIIRNFAQLSWLYSIFEICTISAFSVMYIN